MNFKIMTVKAHAIAVKIGKIEYKLKISLVGFIIITTPTKPIITADHL